MGDCRIKLSRMKPRLFDLNLTVHNLLGEVSQEDVELQQLSSLVADKTKSKRRSSKVTSTPTSLPPPRSPSWTKVSRYWWRMTLLLAMMILTSVFITPNCCEYSNSL